MTSTNMDENIFRIHTYSQMELAKLNFPETVHAAFAVVNFRNLMKRTPDLLNELEEARYKTHDKVFTPYQVAIIIRYWGEPWLKQQGDNYLFDNRKLFTWQSL